MADLIDRQAAIDALHAHLMYRMGTESNKKRLDEWINSLPSAQPEPCEDAVSRRRLLNDLKELIAAWKKYPVMAEQIKGVETAIGYVETIPSVTPKRKTGKWELIYKEPKSDAWACNVTARCSCCGKPLKTLGDRIGWGNDRDTGETIIWSGFITNWKQHKEQARIFALNAGESVPDDLFPKYCENCGADMIGEQNDNDK